MTSVRLCSQNIQSCRFLRVWTLTVNFPAAFFYLPVFAPRQKKCQLNTKSTITTTFCNSFRSTVYLLGIWNVCYLVHVWEQSRNLHAELWNKRLKTQQQRFYFLKKRGLNMSSHVVRASPPTAALNGSLQSARAVQWQRGSAMGAPYWLPAWSIRGWLIGLRPHFARRRKTKHRPRAQNTHSAFSVSSVRL